MKIFSRSSLACVQQTQSIFGTKLSERLSHTQVEEEWCEKPEYPPIVDMSIHSRRRQKKQEWYDKINRLPTIEQKMVEMNMPRFYGYHSVHMKHWSPRVFGLDYVRYVTRTHVENGLPLDYYDDVKEEAERVSKEVAPKVNELILTHLGSKISRNCFRTLIRLEKAKVGNFLRDLTRVTLDSIVKTPEELVRLQVDREPRFETAWLLGGVYPHEAIIHARKMDKRIKIDPAERMENWIRCSSEAEVGMRTEHPLPEVVDRTTHELAAKKDEIEPQDQKASGHVLKRGRIVSVPGFWPGSSKEHGQMFLHSRHFLLKYSAREFEQMHPITDKETLDRLLEQSILMCAFTQAHSHAFYQGFTPFNEMSFPIVQQNVSSDTKMFKFALYQLNACNLIGNDAAHNPYSNIMWISEDMPLYEAIENDQVKGLNEDVLKLFCCMLLKKGVEMSKSMPHDQNGYKYLMDHDASDEFKTAFKEVFHTLTSGRHSPSTLNAPEIFLWERIYDLKFKTRPRDMLKWYKTKNFAPSYYRRLDEYTPVRIPKRLRAHKQIVYRPQLHSEHLFRLADKHIKRAKLKEGSPYLSSMNQTDVRYTKEYFDTFRTDLKNRDPQRK